MRGLLAPSLSLLLAACSSTGETRADFAAANTQGHVEAVTVIAAPAGSSPGFSDAFAARALARLKACAQGRRPLTLQVDILAFHGASAAKAYLIGDSNELRAQARLVDGGGALVGAYDIHRRYSGQDLYGAVAMRDPVGQMAEAFAAELCKQAFAGRGPP